MSDELDTLTDAQLSELVAVEVAGESRYGWVPSYNDPDNSGLADPLEPCTPYVMSFDALLPLLKDYVFWIVNKRHNGEYLALVTKQHGISFDNAIAAISSTPTRALCISLIREVRESKSGN